MSDPKQSELDDSSDEELVGLAMINDLAPFASGAQVEMGRRQLRSNRELREAIVQLRTATDSAARWMIWLTIALVVFTLVIGVMTAVIVLATLHVI